MSSQAAHSVQAVFASVHWLWTWNGSCFGYRRGDSLYTYDGVEVGRFSGKEVYGPDGRYLGEVRSTEGSDDRLITSTYKKARMGATFVPAIERAQPRAADCSVAPLYCGYEDFPSPTVLKDMVLERNTHQRSRIQ
jgi:hypothetical protein